MNTELHFSSEKMDWGTPQDLFDDLNKEFNFDLDVCADYKNHKCKRFFGRYYPSEDAFVDSLEQDWSAVSKSSWMNPPYGREIIKWMKKAYEESLKGCTIVCLVPSRTDTKWWWEYAMRGEIRFIRGRLKFEGATNSAPFPSAIVIFRGIEV